MVEQLNQFGTLFALDRQHVHNRNLFIAVFSKLGLVKWMQKKWVKLSLKWVKSIVRILLWLSVEFKSKLNLILNFLFDAWYFFIQIDIKIFWSSYLHKFPFFTSQIKTFLRNLSNIFRNQQLSTFSFVQKIQKSSVQKSSGQCLLTKAIQQ